MALTWRLCLRPDPSPKPPDLGLLCLSAAVRAPAQPGAAERLLVSMRVGSHWSQSPNLGVQA